MGAVVENGSEFVKRFCTMQHDGVEQVPSRANAPISGYEGTAMQGVNMVDLVCPALRVEHIDDVLADLDREATGAVILSSEVLVHGESAGPGCKITGDEQKVGCVWPKGKGGDGGSRCKRVPYLQRLYPETLSMAASIELGVKNPTLSEAITVKNRRTKCKTVETE